jgi:hypothetical protein
MSSCIPSMFWLTAKNPSFSFASLASAMWPRFGFAFCALFMRSLKNHHTLTGSSSRASMFDRSWGSIPLHRLSSPRKVARPDATESPAPMRARIRLDDRKYCVNDVNSSMSIPRVGFGVSVPRNLRISCLVFNMNVALDLNEEEVGVLAAIGSAPGRATSSSAFAFALVSKTSAALVELCSFVMIIWKAWKVISAEIE